MIQMHIVNLPQVQARFKALNAQVQTKVARSILAVGSAEVARGAAQKAPKRSGRLGKSIKAVIAPTHADIFPTVFWAKWVEEGTRNRVVKDYRGRSRGSGGKVKRQSVNVGPMPAKPFLRPALEDPSVRAAMAAEFLRQMRMLGGV